MQKKLNALLMVLISISICFAQNVNISGKVTDKAGIAIPGASVILEKGGLADTTGADGCFTLIGITGVIENIHQSLLHDFSIKNDFLYINLNENKMVEISTYSMQGKIISTIRKKLMAGTNSIKLECTGSGVYLHRVKTGTFEVVFKHNSLGILPEAKVVSIKGNLIEKKYRNNVTINDVIKVTKAGYLNKRITVTSSDTSGIELKMTFQDTGSITDIDGNIYHTLLIGNQLWMVENFRVTKLNDGTPIPHVTDQWEWIELTTPGYCFYDNVTNTDSIKKFGALYNWYAVNTGKLAPLGWHVPTIEDWNVLQNYLVANGYNWDGTTTEAKIGKSLATQTDWYPSNNEEGAIGNNLSLNNQSGFSALPGGVRGQVGYYSNIGNDCQWWCATEAVVLFAFHRRLWYQSAYFSEDTERENCGLSVRLVKD